jgi:RNA methyltransferase, TrmH family
MSRESLDITSPQNRWIKLARSLHRRRRRYQERAFLVEGVRPMHEARRAGVNPTVVLVDGESEDVRIRDLAGDFHEAGARVFLTNRVLIRHASDTEEPQGILGVFPMFDHGMVAGPEEPALFVIADRIRDPGNLGTLMRTALGAGAHALLVAPESADPYSPKVVRAAAGAHFRLPFAPMSWQALPAPLRECEIIGAESNGSTSYDDVDWTRPICLVIGNETQGLSPGAMAHSRLSVGIPLANNVESLNAATAGAVILFEAARQRRRERFAV